MKKNNGRIKITVITIFFPPEKGAAPSRMYKLCRELVKAGFDVEVITAMPNYPTGRIFPGYRGKYSSVEEMDGITVRRYWVYASNSSNSLARAASMLSFATMMNNARWRLRNRRKPDLIFVQTPPLLAGAAGVRLAKATGAKIVLNVSDLWPLTAVELGAMQRGKLYDRLERLETYMYRNSDLIIGQSQETVDYIQQQHPHKAYFLYRNLDPPSPFRDAGPVYEPGSLKVVYAGLLGVAQGVMAICRGIDFSAMGIAFHIYGAGNEAEELKAYLAATPGCKHFLPRKRP